MRRFHITLYTQEYVRPLAVISASDLDQAIEASRAQMAMVLEYLDLNGMDPATSGMFLTSAACLDAPVRESAARARRADIDQIWISSTRGLDEARLAQQIQSKSRSQKRSKTPHTALLQRS